MKKDSSPPAKSGLQKLSQNFYRLAGGSSTKLLPSTRPGAPERKLHGVEKRRCSRAERKTMPPPPLKCTCRQPGAPKFLNDAVDTFKWYGNRSTISPCGFQALIAIVN